MSRIIKFRAWDMILRKWKTVGETSNCLKYANMYSNPADTELMQYTGLKDKNGVEIYEGDILKWDDDDGGEQHYKVTWADGAYWYDNETFLADSCGEFEVIGNIHENPDLLAT